MAKPRTLVAHTDRTFLDRLARLLASEFEIVGVREDIVVLLDDVRALRPDFVVQILSDASARQIDTLRRLAPDVCVALVTHTGDEQGIENAFDRGVSAVVLQSASDDDLLNAMRAACIGHK